MLMFLTDHPEYDTASDIIKIRMLSKSHVSTAFKCLEAGGLSEYLPLLLCVASTLLWARVAAKFANKASPAVLNRATGIVLTILGAAIFIVNIFS